jgi:hypothetical protein
MELLIAFPVTWEEMTAMRHHRSVEFAIDNMSMILPRLVPGTLGPVTWGWCAYFYSAADNCGPGTDYASHGNVPFTPWYLQQMKAYDDAHSLRILDYLDMHYYPQAQGVALSDAGDAATQARRLRSTRSLWDPTYADESWIAGVAEGPYVRLIPRMQEWVNAYYPGTKLAITEYNWGALDHINGALAQADVLGIFGARGCTSNPVGPPDRSAGLRCMYSTTMGG